MLFSAAQVMRASKVLQASDGDRKVEGSFRRDLNFVQFALDVTHRGGVHRVGV
jgi:hypothetical protein